MSKQPLFKPLPLTLPINYHIPAIYLEGTAEEIALALTFGAEATAALTEEFQANVRDETHQQVIQKATKSKQEELDEANDQLLRTTKQLRRQEKDILDQEQRIRDDERRNREDIIRAKDEYIQMLVQDLPKLTDGFKQLCRQLSRSTTKKGKDDAIQVKTLLKDAFGPDPSFDLTRLGKEGQWENFLMSFAGATFLWEVTSSTHKVDENEVIKLKGDMGAKPKAVMGIMMSLQAEIVGHVKAADIDIEFIQDGRPILYISNLHQRQDKSSYLQSIRPLFKAAAVVAGANHMAANTELYALRERAKRIQSLLKTHQSRVQHHKNLFVNHKKRTDDMLLEFQSFIKTSEDHVAEMLGVIMADAGAAAAPSESISKKTKRLSENESTTVILIE